MSNLSKSKITFFTLLTVMCIYFTWQINSSKNTQFECTYLSLTIEPIHLSYLSALMVPSQ